MEDNVNIDITKDKGLIETVNRLLNSHRIVEIKVGKYGVLVTEVKRETKYAPMPQ